MAEPVKFEMITDYVCPWCYLSTARVEKLKQAFDIETKLVMFPLHPETPEEGLALKALFAGRTDEQIEAMHTRMKDLMDSEGLPYERRTHTYNSRLAQELGKWAETQPGGSAIHAKLYRAYFVEGKNIGDIDVLAGIAESVGLDPAEAKEVLVARSFKEQVDADWRKSRGYGVTGVPTFVAAGQGVVGAQPYEVLEQLVTQAGAARKENPNA